MTRVALLSDIHGNIVALDAVLADMMRHGPFDQVIVAGDLAWSGPWPAEVVDRVQALDAVVIQGNTDAFFGCSSPEEAPSGKSAERFVALLAWMQQQLGPQRVAYLAGLPFSHCITPAPHHTLLAVHANPWDLDRPIVPKMAKADLDALLAADADPDWAVLAFGHVHVPFTCQWRSRTLVDVASVGLSMDGDTQAAYAILTWKKRRWQVEHHRVLYDVRIVAHQMRTGGMPRGKHFAERLMAGSYDS